jgi:hypothetical protein
VTWQRTYVEKEETCPGGGAMRYVVRVDPPDGVIGELCTMIAIEEGSTAHGEKDAMLLDLDAARWLLATLREAIAEAERAEKAARA